MNSEVSTSGEGEYRMWGVRVEFLVFTWNAKTGEPKDTWWDIRPEWAVRAIAV
jgi:hypothetical protein